MHLLNFYAIGLFVIVAALGLYAQARGHKLAMWVATPLMLAFGYIALMAVGFDV